MRVIIKFIITISGKSRSATPAHITTLHRQTDRQRWALRRLLACLREGSSPLASGP